MMTCESTKRACGDACVNTQVENKHCGQCDVACSSDEKCTAGACMLHCPAGTTGCTSQFDAGSPRCVDTSVDPANCGACGRSCAAGELCRSGTCALECASPLSTCSADGGAYCADVRNDPANCGTCGTACGATQSCVASVCTPECTPGSTHCRAPSGGLVCADLAVDAANCGACEKSCQPYEACIGGHCTPLCLGLAYCSAPERGRFCADTSSDPQNCGACARACGLPEAGFACVAGVCKFLGCSSVDYIDCNGDPSDGCECLAAHCSGNVCKKRVFVTSATYTGLLGGTAGADAKCQGLADAAHIGGRFKAWVTSPATRFLHSRGPYVRVDDVVVANSWADLADGVLAAPISRTETGAAPSPSPRPSAARSITAFGRASNPMGHA
ncbi:MAG: hypothetical protein IPG50_39025 [Myxococcales bacterium]|nr:hypothetical protein [Myxococcales bacterium]